MCFMLLLLCKLCVCLYCFSCVTLVKLASVGVMPIKFLNLESWIFHSGMPDVACCFSLLVSVYDHGPTLSDERKTPVNIINRAVMWLSRPTITLNLVKHRWLRSMHSTISVIMLDYTWHVANRWLCNLDSRSIKQLWHWPPYIPLNECAYSFMVHFYHGYVIRCHGLM